MWYNKDIPKSSLTKGGIFISRKPNKKLEDYIEWYNTNESSLSLMDYLLLNTESKPHNKNDQDFS